MKQELMTIVLGASALLLTTNCEERANANTPDGGFSGGDGADKVILTTELPPDDIQGTPTRMRVIPKGLLPKPAKVPSLLVPRGTTLLSGGKNVTSSDDYPIIGSLDLVTDGDKRFEPGYFVELIDGVQWIQIDLEQSAAIHGIWVWHFNAYSLAYHDVVIQVSDDPEFHSGVTTVYNNDYDNSARLGKGRDRPYTESHFGLLVAGKGTKGRYVRLYSKGNTTNDMNHYAEVEVFGIR